VSDQVRSGILKLALAGGLLYLFVTGGLKKFTDQLTGGAGGAPSANAKAYPFRDLVAKGH
jgi:hypothetical protein